MRYYDTYSMFAERGNWEDANRSYNTISGELPCSDRPTLSNCPLCAFKEVLFLDTRVRASTAAISATIRTWRCGKKNGGHEDSAVGTGQKSKGPSELHGLSLGRLGITR